MSSLRRRQEVLEQVGEAVGLAVVAFPAAVSVAEEAEVGERRTKFLSVLDKREFDLSYSREVRAL